MQDFVSLEDIKDCVGGCWYVIKLLCPARRNTYRQHMCHRKWGKTGWIQENPKQILESYAVGLQEEKKGKVCVRMSDYAVKGQSVYVHVLLTRERLTILWLKLKRDHMPGEQYTMQMKLLHMVRIHSALSLSQRQTRAEEHVYFEKPSTLPHFHAKSAKTCNSYLCPVCNRKKGKQMRGKQNEKRGQEMDNEEKSRRLIRGNKRNQPKLSSAATD